MLSLVSWDKSGKGLSLRVQMKELKNTPANQMKKKAKVKTT
jgi:hypothetical protein